MALSSAAVFGVMGLAVDVGRIFIAKSETQAYCDAAALAAALALDGTSLGLGRARTAVSSSLNRWNFDTSSVSAPTVTFANAATGPWVASPTNAAGYTFVRVISTVPVQLYFLPVVVAQNTFNLVSTATASQIPITSLARGIAPYTAVTTTPTGPTFGFTPGNSYDIQWPQYNSTRAGCGPANPDKCFNANPCSGDSTAVKAAVVTNWGPSTSGYWGGSSNSDIAAEVLDLIQLAPVSVGTNMAPLLAGGNKASEASYLDQRASQDTNTTDNTPTTYQASSTRNGRRLLPVVIVQPISPSRTDVVGYGLFLLTANGSPSNYYTKTTNGNDAFCATYVGPYNVGGMGPGAGGSTGASWVGLVE